MDAVGAAGGAGAVVLQVVGDLAVVGLMTETVDALGVIIDVFCERVLFFVGFVKFPDLNVVEGAAADTDRSFFAEKGEGTFLIALAKHGDKNIAEGAVFEAEEGGAGVFAFDVAGEGAEHGFDVGDFADEEAHGVDEVDALIEEGAAVEGLGAAPGIGVVVVLRAFPNHRAVDGVDFAEAAGVDGGFEEFKGGIESVLKDTEELHAFCRAGIDQGLGGVQRYVHGFFDEDMFSGAGGEDAVFGVEAGRGADADHVDVGIFKHVRQAGVALGAAGVHALFKRCRFGVADGEELGLGAQVLDSVEVGGSDAAVAGEGEMDGGHW